MENVLKATLSSMCLQEKRKVNFLPTGATVVPLASGTREKSASVKKTENVCVLKRARVNAVKLLLKL